MDKKNKEIEIIEPRMVKSHDVKLDAEYAEWIAEVKHRYRSAQVKSAVKVNGEKLLFNWQMGRDLVQKKAEERWGAGVIEQVSLDMQKEFPESKNFSVRNLWYMKQWYLFYTENMEKLKQLVSEFPSAFACVPWGHHVRIVQHSETIEEALFYVGYTIKEGISSDTLERVMKDDIYNKRGKAPNNFPKHLTPQLAGLAQQVVKGWNCYRRNSEQQSD